MKKALLLLGLLLIGCSSTELVDSWKNPDIVIFDANKVLIVGMTSNAKAQEDFETKMKKQFTERGVEAMRSVDLFDVGFTNSARSEEELDEVEQSLLEVPLLVLRQPKMPMWFHIAQRAPSIG